MGDKSMKKCLKINDCFQKIISQDLIPLLFVNDSAFRNGWIYNFFYNIVIENETLVFADNDGFEKTGCFLYYAYNFPVARSKDVAPVSKVSFIKRLKSFIDDEKYLVAIYNNPDEKNRFLLYGYDDDRECFMSYIFKKDCFIAETILYDEIMDNIIEQVNNIADGRIQIRCFKENPYYKEKFKFDAMFEQIKAFLNQGTDKTGKMGLLDAEKFLKALADNGKISSFKKSLKCLEQHLLFMNERLEYASERYSMKNNLGNELGEKAVNAATAIRSLRNKEDMLPVPELRQKIHHMINEIYTAYQAICDSYNYKFQ
jgi:hypothetical protein